MKGIINSPAIHAACALSILGMLACNSAEAQETHKAHQPTFFAGAALGYGAMNDTTDASGNVTEGRLDLGSDIFRTGWVTWGLELGVQSGNDVRLGVDLNDYPIDATLKPFFDVLATLKTVTDRKHPWGVFLKGGMVYQQLQLENRSSNEDNIQQVMPEFQAGIAYQISTHAKLTAFYQGIYGTSDVFKFATNQDVLLENIPTQQAGFIGFEYIL